jgi:hypothetical protein
MQEWRRGEGEKGGEDIYRVALCGKPYEKKKMAIKIFFFNQPLSRTSGRLGLVALSHGDDWFRPCIRPNLHSMIGLECCLTVLGLVS